MTPTSQDHIRTIVLDAIAEVAPEADLGRLKPDVSIREQLDIDSMDFLNFVIGLHHALHVDIPEVDYPKLETLDGCAAYLAALGPGPGGAARR